MNPTILAFFHSPVTQGALTGATAAAAVDIHAFQQWKSFDDAIKYSWGTAFFRWSQGAIVGAVTSFGLAGL